MPGRFCTRTSQRHMRLSKKIFFVQKRTAWAPLRGVRTGSQEFPKILENICAPPPRNHQNVTCWVSFSGRLARTWLLRRRNVQESRGESSHMRAGGATEAIWDDSAHRFRETVRTYRRCRTPLMYMLQRAEGVPPSPKTLCFLEKTRFCVPNLAAGGCPRER